MITTLLRKMSQSWHVLLLVQFIFLSACTKDMGSTSIEIPPGTLVEYSNSEFVVVSSEFYTVELKKVLDDGSLVSIEDITPKANKTTAQTVNYILPKDKNQAGIFVVQANLIRQNVYLSAIVIPGRVTTPTIATNLVVELITNYPGKAIGQYSAEEIIALEKAAQEVIDDRNKNFRFPQDTSMSAKIKFFKNAIGSTVKFLDLCDDAGIEFSYDSNGLVTSLPYPFGKQNRMPVIDQANSTPVNREVKAVEKAEMVLTAQGQDPDGDLILYRWYRGEVVMEREDPEITWVPTYDDGRDAPYPFKIVMTDGGIPQTYSWDVLVANRNRKPEVTEKCAREVTEWETFTCKISAVDFDGDAFSFTINDSTTDARATMNGQLTVDPDRTLTVSGVSEIEVKFTPNNNDAAKRSAYIEVTVLDVNGGQTSVPLSLAVRDINSPPALVGGAVTLPFGGGSNEWDYCAEADPDGAGPYWFYIRVDDPDNTAAAAPRSQHPDTVSVNFGGNLRDQVRRINDPLDVANFIPNNVTGCPADTVESKFFCFEWKPEHTRKTGNLTILAKDNHGGIAELQTLNLTAFDRNVRPCITASGRLDQLLYDSSPTSSVNFTASDADQVSPYVLLKGVAPQIVPFLKDCTVGTVPMVLRQTVFEGNELLYRIEPTLEGGSSAGCISSALNSTYSGTVQFQRNAAYTSAITIPAGYTLETPILSGVRVRYKTAVAVTMRPEDVKVLVPIEAVERSAAALSVNRFINTPPQPDMTVAHGAALETGGLVRFSRTNTAAAITIPAATVIGTTETSGPNVSTIRFQTMNPATMAAGTSFVDVAVTRTEINVPAGILTSMTGSPLADASITATNIVAVKAYTNYSLSTLNGYGTTLGQDRFCYSYYAEDGTSTPAGTLNQFASAPPETGMTVSNPAAVKLYGVVRVTRASAAAARTIPAGTVVKDIIGTQYRTRDTVTIPAGTITQDLVVGRTANLSPVVDPTTIQACTGFSDTNYPPQLITSTNMVADEGILSPGHLMEVTDNTSDVTQPKDPADRHQFAFAPLGNAPTGTIRFCRDPSDSTTNINSPACVPCTGPTGDYFRSSRCYVRFMPGYDDIGENYLFSVTVLDNGMTFPSGRNQLNSSLSLTIREKNDPPVVTDSTYAPVSGNSQSQPIELGSFVEGTQSEYFIYATDPDKTENLKRLGYALHTQVYDVQTGTWVASPSGLSVVSDAYNGDPLGTGWTSRNRAKLRWNPTDADAKRLAGTQGFVVRVSFYDSTYDSSTRLTTYGYYKMSVVNLNNPPYLKSFNTGNVLTIQADTYFKNEGLSVLDKDNSTVGAPVNHTTSLSLCRSQSVFSCNAPRTGWPDELQTYDAGYVGNSAVASCRNGGSVYTQIALPYLTRINSAPEAESSTLARYRYRFEWCAQRSHIGVHNAFLFVNDNGDKDRNNVTHAVQSSVAPLQLKVVAPVFFESPAKDTSGTVVHYMQQAFANLSANYVYPTIVKNSRGNALTYSLVTAPTGMTVNSSGVISWKPTSDQITTSNQATWHTVSVRVRDNSTSETDTATYKVQVKNPLSPVQVAPVFDSYFPASAQVTVKERTYQTFSVQASDGNDNPLHYRWYVNNVLKYDRSSSYEYIPSMEDGYTDGDGTGTALRPGQHAIKVEVTDGSAVITRSWVVNVVNTIPSPLLSFTLGTAVSGITNLNWNTEIGVPITSGTDYWNSVVFAASYTRNSTTRNTVYNVRYKNGVIQTLLSTEALQWPAGKMTERLSYAPGSGTNFNVSLTSQPMRTGPFSQLTEASYLPSSLGLSALNPAHLCNSACTQSLYSTNEGYGTKTTAVFSSNTGKHTFIVSDSADTIEWDIDGSSPQTFMTLSGGLRVSGMAVNNQYKRLYASVRDVGMQINRIYVWDLNSVESGLLPTLVTPSGINIYDGVNTDNRILDLVVIDSTRQVFALLPGTGGVAVLTDPVSSTPSAGNVQFVGVADISSSFSEAPNSGRKLVYNSKSNLLYGISKDSNELFSINPSTYEVKVYAADVNFDSLITFSNDLLTLAINRSLGRVYILR